MRKIKYQNWIYEISTETSPQASPIDWHYPVETGEIAEKPPPSVGEDERGVSSVDPEIEQKVQRALSRLAAREKFLIEQFYFQGRNYQEIAQILRLNLKQVEYLHRKAVFKLRNLLADFVKKRFKIRIDQPALEKSVNLSKTAMGCIICQNPRQKEIERIVSSKKDYQTWRVILKKLKNKFNLDIKAPQVLIGHMKHKT